MTAGELSYMGGVGPTGRGRAAARDAVLRDLVDRGILVAVEILQPHRPHARLTGYALAPAPGGGRR